MFTSIDLFAGPGGLCTGFKWSGIKPLIAIEWSYWTVQTYSKTHNADIFNLDDYLNGKMQDVESFFRPNTNTLLIYGDINKVESALVKEILNRRFGVESVDVVTGGAPCESFSMAGDRKEDDDRNYLFMNILRIARELDVPIILFENVKGLLSKKLKGIEGKMFEAICDEFEKKSRKTGVKYKLASRDKNEILLKAINYGVPQLRERIFLVAINTKYKVQFVYPKPTHGYGTGVPYVTVGDALLDLPQIGPGQESNEYNFDIDSIKENKRKEFIKIIRGISKPVPSHLQFSNRSLSSHKTVNHRNNILQRIQLIQQGENMVSACERLAKENVLDQFMHLFPKKLYAARNRRLQEGQYSFTVTSHCLDEMLHPRLNRALTPREAARLQSFPDWYVFEGPYVKFHSDPQQDRYEQIGDAIPPLLAYNLGIEISKTLEAIFPYRKEEIKQQESVAL